MTSTAEQSRSWQGPALFAYGFRPFFLAAGLWAGLAMALWIGMLAGRFALPTAFDPVSWHAHEFLYGYLGAVMAGFLLTAVPNWTGRRALTGWPLVGLSGLWVLGRLAVALSLRLSPVWVAVADLALPLALFLVIGWEIISGRNWRNLGVLALLAIFALGNAIFHCDGARNNSPAQGMGLRIGVAAAILMIAVVGGRIVPAFTRNWLTRNNPGRLPSQPEQAFDKVALAGLLLAGLGWIFSPAAGLTTALLAIAGLLHLFRLARWAGDRTRAEPLVWVLHLAYGFVPAGALALAVANVAPAWGNRAAGQHLWMAGAIGMMTLAVMTRATRGHTGRALAADRTTAWIYIALLAAVLLRVAAGFWPELSGTFYTLAGTAWIGCYAGFCWSYGPMLLRPKQG
ncbi:short-chain dehydrogenase [Novosphingobium sp. FSY-8]|uniref:Short-chain dehydrogenase n=1 Tax=Novosphingobium ovatum TaxID=1908523 RepID=A0ABW9XFE2_9SPHN|nr:NnrS family protein [Novosphingobium ovatum]NBC37219.1 short-chain dehydrogenase [Novosphingobium ovatum]